MNAQSIDQLIDTLYIVRNRICAYIGNERQHMCDCKYGVTPDRNLSGEAGSGCPEILDAIDFLVQLKLQNPNVASSVMRSLHPIPSRKLIAKHEDDPEEHAVWCDCDHCMYTHQDLRCGKSNCLYCDDKEYNSCPNNCDN